MNKEEAKSLLPWFAAGALDADEMRTVEAHLRASPELQRELAELKVMQDAVNDAENEPVFRPALINDALRQIEAFEATQPAPASPGLFANAVEWLRETLVGGWVQAPAGARLAMVAQFALILVLGGILMTPTETGTNVVDPAYTTMSAAATADGAGTALVVDFQPTATEQRISQVLSDIDGEIVAGPSARGSYTIRIETESQADVTRALDTLRGNSDAVRFASKAE